MKHFLSSAAALLLLVGCLEPSGSSTTSSAPPPNYEAQLLAAAPPTETILSIIQIEKGIRAPKVSLAPSVDEADPMSGIHLSLRRIANEVMMNGSKPESGEIVYAYSYQDPHVNHSGYITLHYQWWDRWVRSNYSFPEEVEGFLSIMGLVRDENTSEHLQGAMVSVEQPSGPSVDVPTTMDGQFLIHGLRSEISDLVVNRNQYAGVVREIHPDVDHSMLVEMEREDNSVSAVSGYLAYRKTCQENTELQPAGTMMVQGRVLGPWLSLEDADGLEMHRTLVGPDGQFRLEGVAQGTYTLHLEAEQLNNFWHAGAVTTEIAVQVTEDMIMKEAEADTGVLCMDNDVPTIESIKAMWGEDYMEALVLDPAYTEMLHIEAAANIATLSVQGDAETPLQASWGAMGGFGDRLNNDAVRWGWSNTERDQVISIHLTDGRGGYRNISVPVRLHELRIDAQSYGGWQDFSIEDTFRAYQSFSEGDAAHEWYADINGMGLFISDTTLTGIQGRLGTVRFGMSEPLTLSPSFEVLGLNGNVDIMNGFINGSVQESWIFVLRHRDNETEWEFRIHDNPVAFGFLPSALQPGDIVDMELTLDPVQERFTAYITVNNDALSVGVGVTLSPHLRVSHGFAVGTNMDSEGSLTHADIVFEGLEYSRDEMIFVLPSIPGELDGVTYDQNPIRTGEIGTALIHDGYFVSGSDDFYLSLHDLPVFSRVMQDQGSLLTDMSYDEVVDIWGDSMEYFDEAVAVPLTSGNAYLY